MASFIRINKCFCSCGSLRAGAVAIGIFYFAISILGVSVTYSYIKTAAARGDLTYYSECEEQIFLPLLEIAAFVSMAANVSLIYGVVSQQHKFISAWLAWHIILPFAYTAVIIWGIVELVSCDFLETTLQNVIIGILVCTGIVLVTVFYFAIVVFSLYRNFLENTNNKYGARTLLPSKDWDSALSPYTNYDYSSATPQNWANMQPQQQAQPANRPPPPPPPPLQRQKTGIPRPQSQAQYFA